ncbi:FecR family protein [Bordetella genomosp. 13]|uniref:FecR family protein n=1 Tax=Bordetella genomosp. 13 TaxID=463040 RepID=UPI0016431551|nr:DUF4880 domain-containing protein [Bordetella genomosp. 13]
MPSSSDPNTLYRTATAWLARRKSPGWTDADQREMDAWLQADPSHAQAYQRMLAAQGGLGSAPAAAAAGGVPGGQGMPVQRKAGGWGWKWWLASAVGLGLAVALTVSFVLRESTPQFSQRVKVEGGQARDWQLPGGSVVVLNSGTEAAAAYFSRRREVSMSHGQALYRAAYMARTSFIVHVGNEDIIVDGGRVPVPDVVFDVSSARDVLEVRVAAGKVKIRTVAAGAREELEVEAGQAIAIDRPRRTYEIEKIDPRTVGDWQSR